MKDYQLNPNIFSKIIFSSQPLKISNRKYKFKSPSGVVGIDPCPEPRCLDSLGLFTALVLYKVKFRPSMKSLQYLFAI